MLQIFYKRFYILMFLIWFVAVSGLFVLSVWGDFGTFMADIDKIIHAESFSKEYSEIFSGGNETNSSRLAGVHSNSTESVGSIISEEGGSVRRVVVRDFREIENDVKTFLGDKPVSVANKTAEVRKSAPRKNTAPAGHITKIELVSRDDSLLAHIIPSERIEHVTSFWIRKSLKLVVDIKGNWINDTPNVFRLKGSFIEKVIVGRHPDKFRIVFQLSPDFMGSPDNSNATEINTISKPSFKKPDIAETPKGVDIIIDRPGQ